MKFLLIASLLAAFSTADILERIECWCYAAPLVRPFFRFHKGHHHIYKYMPSKYPNVTLTIDKKCMTTLYTGACDQNEMYPSDMAAYDGRHVFRYHRTYYLNKDSYEFDNSGKKRYHKKEAKHLGDAHEICKPLCLEVDTTLRPKCRGNAMCKAKRYDLPDLP